MTKPLLLPAPRYDARRTLAKPMRGVHLSPTQVH
jgi:hypothetical protein